MTDRVALQMALLEELQSGKKTKEQVLAELSIAASRGFECGHTGTKCDSNGTLRDKMIIYGARSQGRPMEFSDAEWDLIESHFDEIKTFRVEKLAELRVKAKADLVIEQAEKAAATAAK